MTPEILTRIIHEKLYFEFALILLVYLIVIFVNIKLGFRMLGIRIETQKMLWAVGVIVLYNIGAKQVISFLPGYGLIFIILLAISIKLIGAKAVTLVKSFWAAFLVVSITYIGVLVIELPLMFDAKIAQFIVNTPIGVAVGSLCELIFPLFSLFLLKTIDLSIIPPLKRKLTLIDAANLYIFAGLFSLLYIAFEQTLKGLVDQTGIINSLLFHLFIASTLLAVFYFVFITTKKRHDSILEENQRLEAEKSQLITKIKDLTKSSNIDYGQLGPVINEFIEKISPILARSFEKKPQITPNLNNLAKYNLDERDGELIGRVVINKTYAQIAEEIHLAPGTVANKVWSLLKKLNLKDREDLSRFALENDLVEIINQ